MESHRSSARRVLADGLVVERLPLGFAAERWWATFVSSGGVTGADARASLTRAVVGSPDGLLDCVGGGGGGDDEESEFTWELVDRGAAAAEVHYDGSDPELLRLDSADRAGTFAVRLPDGSLIERLPVGHARGRWRLRWVRSDVPATEVEAAWADDAEPTSPFDRLIRVRSAFGPLGPQPSSWSEGAIQPCATGVPDTIAHLEVDYLHDGEVAATETLVLPQP